MTVTELIEKLREMPGEATVVIPDESAGTKTVFDVEAVTIGKNNDDLAVIWAWS